MLGPAPAPLGKLRGEYRAQLLIKGTNRKRMREALMSVLAERPDLARRTVVDVDPLSVSVDSGFEQIRELSDSPESADRS